MKGEGARGRAHAFGRLLRFGAIGALALAVLVAIAAGSAWRQVSRGVALLEGEQVVPGLEAPVEIKRDERGVPSIVAAHERGALFGLGFVHAQDRFFQMDVARRAGAGRLAELFGEPVLDLDIEIRKHDLAGAVETAMGGMPAGQRQLLADYTRGVNAGLEALRVPPFEYFVLGAEPAPWREQDALLVVMQLYLLLQLNHMDQEYHLASLYDALPDAAEFLAPLGTSWDAPIDASELPFAAVPPGDPFRVARALGESPARVSAPTPPLRGSNSWAFAGGRTAHGGALLANDMHLSFQVPNAFYQVSLEYSSQSRAVHGVTVPGYPAVVAGSNGDVAWTLTNSGADSLDLIRLDQAGLDDRRYRTPEGVERLASRVERIEVKGGDTVEVTVDTTRWGPVVREAHDGTRYAVRWVAHQGRAVNLELMQLHRATTLEQSLDIANQAGVPLLNFIAGSRDGRIGWTIAGAVPRRGQLPSRVPRWSRQVQDWSGWLVPGATPRHADPQSSYLWTANTRVVGGGALDRLGHGFYILGARASQIRDRLRELDRVDEAAMLSVQQDDEARFLYRWRDLLVQALEPTEGAGERERSRVGQVQALLLGWDGHAGADSVAYRLVREYHDEVGSRVAAAVQARVREYAPDFEMSAVGDQFEGPLWALVNERPPQWLPPGEQSWEGLLAGSAQTVLTNALAASRDLNAHRWGERNRLAMRHPFSFFFPFVGKLLDLPAQPLGGDLRMPLAQYVDQGPVMRMVVAPGREEHGLLALVGGPSGNPASPFYRSTHSQWVDGAGPLIPTATSYRLMLKPALD